MKKLGKVLLSALCLALCVFTLVGCSSYGSVLKAFEKEGFKESETMSNIFTDITKDLEEDEIVMTPHVLTKGLTCTVLIIEFKSTDDMKKAVDDSATIKGLLKDLSESDYINGNCMFLPVACVSPSLKDALEICKNA